MNISDEDDDAGYSESSDDEDGDDDPWLRLDNPYELKRKSLLGERGD